jgi:hypothetical protein
MMTYTWVNIGRDVEREMDETHDFRMHLCALRYYSIGERSHFGVRTIGNGDGCGERKCP